MNDQPFARGEGSKTLVSVIMPMRNVEAFIEPALSSVLQERSVPLEVVVVDDGSTDGSRERVQSFDDRRIRLVDGPQRGIAACLNAALAEARGDIVMRCDSDDMFAPERIARQVGWLAAHPDHDAVCGGYCTISHEGTLVAELLSARQVGEDIHGELRRGVTRTSLCSFAIRRQAIERAGPFREYFVSASDIDFLLRLGEVARVHYLPENTYYYRLHESSLTHTQARRSREFYEQTARQFQVERLSSGSDALQRGTPPPPPEAANERPSSAASQIQGMLVGRAWRLFDQGERQEALRLAIRAIRLGPIRSAPWRALLVMGWRSMRMAR